MRATFEGLGEIVFLPGFLFLLLLLLLIEKSQKAFWEEKWHCIPPLSPFLRPLWVLSLEVDIVPGLLVAGNHHFNDGHDTMESISGSVIHQSSDRLLLLEM